MLRSYLPKGHPLKHLEIGQEKTPQDYVAKMVRVFGLVRQCLAEHGTLWVNVGDTYSGAKVGSTHKNVWQARAATKDFVKVPLDDLEDGNLALIPQRLAIALQDAGWIVRSYVIWHKPSPMPASVSGWAWRRCRVKERAQGKASGNQNWAAYTGQPPRAGGVALAPAEWSDCPGCKKCTPNGGYVLRRGSWRPTSSYEPILMLAKSSKYFADGIALANSMMETRYEEMQQLQQNSGSVIFREKQNASGRVAGRMPDLFENESLSLEKNAKGQGIGTRDGSEILSQQARQSKEEGLSSNRKNEDSSKALEVVASGNGICQEVQEIATSESSGEKVQFDAKRTSVTKKKLKNGKRARSTGEGRAQASVEPEKLHKHTDGSGMEGDQGSSESSLLLLQGEKSPDDGPCDSDNQGRQPCEGEHSSSVSELQCEQGYETDGLALICAPNPRDVWRISAEPLHERHFAAYPTELVRRCLQAGVSAHGYCETCGGPWVRVVDTVKGEPASFNGSTFTNGKTGHTHGEHVGQGERVSETRTIGWRASCTCKANAPRPGLVLDPFCGSGRTAITAQRLGLDFIGVELNSDYVTMGERKIREDSPLFT